MSHSKEVMGELRAHFRPEFLNRTDDVMLCKPLTLAKIEEIVELLIAELHQPPEAGTDS